MRRSIPAVVAVLLVIALLPGLAAAETRSGGTITVGPDETIEGDLQAFGGTVVIEGTVTGDVEVFAGTVVVDGRVGGNLEGFAGSVTIDGTVDGNVEAAGGTVDVTEGATIGGTLEAGAGAVTMDGTVAGDARLGGDQITLGPNAQIEGDLSYDGTLDRAPGAVVGGSVTQTDEVEVSPTGPGLGAGSGVFTVYGVLVNLVAGAILLLAFPRFSTTVADGVADKPLRSAGYGLVALIGIPLLLTLLLLTIVGIPLSIVGFLIFAVLAWVGALYGRFAVGRWALGLADVESRWAALFVGVVGVAVLKLVPILGGLLEFGIFLLGLGALALVLLGIYRSDDDAGASSADQPATDQEAA